MAVDRYQNSTNYEHSQESNLLNVHKAMDYSAAGEPLLRVNNVGGVSYNDASAVDAAVRSAINTGYGSTNSDTWTLVRYSHIFIGEKI